VDRLRGFASPFGGLLRSGRQAGLVRGGYAEAPVVGDWLGIRYCDWMGLDRGIVDVSNIRVCMCVIT